MQIYTSIIVADRDELALRIDGIVTIRDGMNEQDEPRTICRAETLDQFIEALQLLQLIAAKQTNKGLHFDPSIYFSGIHRP